MAKLDWASIETKLVAQATKALATFAKQHAKDTFYGAMFSIEPFFGVSISIRLNTREHLVAQAGANADRPEYKWLPASFEHILWLTKSITGWAAIDKRIVAATEADMAADRTSADGNWATTGALIDAVCRVVLKLERDRAFAALTKTPDFAIAVSPDASEPGDMSLARMTRFRKRKAKPKPKRK